MKSPVEQFGSLSAFKEHVLFSHPLIGQMDAELIHRFAQFLYTESGCRDVASLGLFISVYVSSPGGVTSRLGVDIPDLSEGEQLQVAGIVYALHGTHQVEADTETLTWLQSAAEKAMKRNKQLKDDITVAQVC